MDDKQLVDFAAKACGFEVLRDDLDYPWRSDKPHEVFDPLNDDGDAFRIALHLCMKIEYWPEQDSVMCSLPGSQGATTVAAIGDVELRRAITRAAAIYAEHMGDAKDGL